MEKYFSLFVKSGIEALSLTLEQNDGKRIGNFQKIIDVVINLKKFDKISIEPINRYLVKIDRSIYKKLADYERRYLLDVVSLDENNYDFIYDLMIDDMDNCSDYLQYLISIDAEKAIDHFFQIYRNIKKLKKFNLRLFFQSIISKIRNEQTENIHYRRYDNENQPRKNRFCIFVL